MDIHIMYMTYICYIDIIIGFSALKMLNYQFSINKNKGKIDVKIKNYSEMNTLKKNKTRNNSLTINIHFMNAKGSSNKRQKFGDSQRKGEIWKG